MIEEIMLVEGRGRERGNTLVISFLLVTLLTALATAHFATVQKNSRQSVFVNDLRELRRYAQSGVRLAIHELTYDTGMGDGKIGTELWTTANDLGRDGRPGTYDEGEGDGIPTPGEPNLIAAPIGNPAEGVGLLVQTTDTAWPGIRRIVASAFNSQTHACVEAYVRESVTSVPGVGAAYVQPAAVLDLRGNSFRFDGHDTKPGGGSGTQPTVYGITTALGSPPGTNRTALIDQVPALNVDQIVGQDPNPSIGEAGSMDIDSVFNAFKASHTTLVAPGSYSDVTWGDDGASAYQVTFVNGDLTLDGDSKGAGALVVEGSLTITGKLEFVGIIIVRGDLRITGGSSDVRTYGSLVVGQTLMAVEPDPTSGSGGNAEFYFSSEGIARAVSLLGSTYSILYWNDLK